MASKAYRTAVRRLCYASLPVAAILIVPAFSLMPNRKHNVSVFEADGAFQVGFAMALFGVAMAVAALLVLILVAED